MKKVLVLGKNSFIASHLVNYTLYDNRVMCSDADIEKMIDSEKPDVIINCIAFTGSFGQFTNIDGCETDKSRTVMTNLTIPTLLAFAAKKKSIHFIQIGSGCINYGPSPNIDANGKDLGWKENDISAPLSFYSKVKYSCDLALSDFSNVFIPRIRMPISSKNHPRNLFNKILSYQNVLDEPNSVSFLDDVVKSIEWAIENQKIGIYNVANPSPLTHPEIIEEYKKYFNHSYNKISKEELDKITLAPRSNCIVNIDKAISEGLVLRDSKQALKETMKAYIQNFSI